MGKTQHFAALHYVHWYSVEPPYKDNVHVPDWKKTKKEKNTSKTKKNLSAIKAETRIGERVYRKHGLRRTAVIESNDNNILKIRYDDNNHVSSFQTMDWVLRVPFLSIDNYPAIYSKVENLNSFIGFRFDNLKNPKWVKGILRPCYDERSGGTDFVLKAIDRENKDKTVEEASSYNRFEIQAVFSEDTDDNKWWMNFFLRCFNTFRQNDINYVGIPYIHDVCSLQNETNIAKIAFETALDWINGNPDYGMRVIFICTSVDVYEEYSKVCEEHTVTRDI